MSIATQVCSMTDKDTESAQGIVLAIADDLEQGEVDLAYVPAADVSMNVLRTAIDGLEDGSIRCPEEYTEEVLNILEDEIRYRDSH